MNQSQTIKNPKITFPPCSIIDHILDLDPNLLLLPKRPLEALDLPGKERIDFHFFLYQILEFLHVGVDVVVYVVVTLHFGNQLALQC